MYIALLLLTVALAVLSRPAAAQSPWSGMISGGYTTGLDNGDFTHGSGAFAVAVFGRGGRNLGFGAELGYDKHEERLEVVADLGGRELDRSAWHLTAMMRVRPQSGLIRPYGLAGIGVYALSQDGEDFFAPGLNLGGGVEFHSGDGPFGMSLGARLHLAGKPGDDALQGAGFLALMLGVTYR